MLYDLMNIHKNSLMHYNIYIFVVIAIKSMMIYNTQWTRCNPLKFQWIMYYKSHILPSFLCYFN